MVLTRPLMLAVTLVLALGARSSAPPTGSSSATHRPRSDEDVAGVAAPDLARCPLCGGRVRALFQVVGRSVRQCLRCRLSHLHPPPHAETAAYYDTVYRDEAIDRHIMAGRRLMFEQWLRASPPGAGRRLLDVGCGAGDFVDLARRFGWDAWGLEASAAAVDRAQRRGCRVHLRAGGPMAFASESFDVVTFWNTVDYLARPLEDMMEAHRVLAPGGGVFVRTLNQTFHLAVSRARQLRVAAPFAGLLDRAHFLNPLLWSGPSLRWLLGAAGFQNVMVANARVTPGDPYRSLPFAQAAVTSLAKRTIYGAAQLVALPSRGRLLIGSSLVATARKTPA